MPKKTRRMSDRLKEARRKYNAVLAFTLSGDDNLQDPELARRLSRVVLAYWVRCKPGMFEGEEPFEEIEELALDQAESLLSEVRGVPKQYLPIFWSDVMHEFLMGR
jgi:hypothetical protein